jgi:NADPH:quinone reductase
LGAGERELVVLYPGAPRPAPRGTTGLYHLAIHLPSRKELARAVGRLFARRYPNAPTDHVVTETTYLSDPDGNGIELTFETPERGRLIVTADGLPQALDVEGNVRSGRDPLDLDSLLGELVPGEPLEAPLSEGAKIGHVHLHVADILDAMRFYRDELGFEELNLEPALGMGDVNIPGHVPHVIAFNTWAGQGTPQPPEDAAGLRHFTIELPTERDLEATVDRLGSGGLSVLEASLGFFVQDPSANTIHLTVRDDVRPLDPDPARISDTTAMQSKQPKKEKIETMRAFTLESFDSSPALHEVPTPQIAPNEVLVRVHASSVNPVDGAIAAGMMSGMVEHEFPVILGRDYAGVVEQVGSDVTRYAEGDEVYGFVPAANPTVHDGSWAELLVVPEDNFVARKPAGVELAAAGAAGLAGITALTALDALDVSEGDTVLVVGANGGVGSFAVQLAANAGATVIAPGLPEDEEYLRDLGVSEVLERDADVAALVHERYPDGIDALLDLVSYAPEGFDTHAAVLKDDGRGATPLSAAGEGPGRHNIAGVPTPENLERLGRLLEAGTLRVPIQNTYGLDQAGEALGALGTAHTQGKLAIQVT